MSNGDLVYILQQAIMTVITVSLPVVGIGLTVGMLVSIFQAATQINEQTLAMVPKIMTVFISLIFLGPWILTKLTDFVKLVFETMSNVVG